MPESFLRLAKSAARTSGFENFEPDSCLINCYKIGAKMSLHQDKNEKDFSQPIVSVSLGLPATFLLGGLLREDKTIRLPLTHGDVLVWGGTARLFFHGILPVKAGSHPLLGEQRINLTFRKAL
jgi:alkylated DNA repair protein (DNA oxidative demethylase)